MRVVRAAHRVRGARSDVCVCVFAFGVRVELGSEWQACREGFGSPPGPPWGGFESSSEGDKYGGKALRGPHAFLRRRLEDLRRTFFSSILNDVFKPTSYKDFAGWPAGRQAREISLCIRPKSN